MWADWFRSSFFENIQVAQDTLLRKAAAHHTTIPLLLQGGAEEPTPKKDWQKRCREELHRVDQEVIPRHLRRKLDYFRMWLLPERRGRRALSMLKGIVSLVPPRVWFATLRALCNGWTTNARFQRQSPCLFGCRWGKDKLQHYAECAVVEDFSRRWLHLESTAEGEKLERFLALSATFSEATSSELARRALCLYTVYATTNAARHGKNDCTVAALVQHAREACAAHGPLNRIWTAS